MGNPGQTICITCANAIDEALRLNLLPSGEPCPTCRDRILEALPPLLPASRERFEVLPEPTDDYGESFADPGPPDDPIGA